MPYWSKRRCMTYRGDGCLHDPGSGLDPGPDQVGLDVFERPEHGSSRVEDHVALRHGLKTTIVTLDDRCDVTKGEGQQILHTAQDRI